MKKTTTRITKTRRRKEKKDAREVARWACREPRPSCCPGEATSTNYKDGEILRGPRGKKLHSAWDQADQCDHFVCNLKDRNPHYSLNKRQISRRMHLLLVIEEAPSTWTL